MKRVLLVAFVAVLLLGAVAAVRLSQFYDEHERALAAPMPMAQKTLFTINAGSNFKKIANEFAERQWLAAPRFLYWYARQKKLPINIKAGTYALNPGMSVLDALALFVEGREVQLSFAIIEGWTFRQLRAALEASAHLEQTLVGLDDEQVMERVQRADQHPEGMFLADTYLFPPGTTDIEALRRARAALQRRLDELWADREPDLPLAAPYEGLILASIIEKETADPAERPLIAGVFIERLRRNMLLQTDPTVIYGLGPSFDGNLRRRDLRADTPYNTYTRKGLPPTPIAIVGASALHAAFHPQIDGSLFFVARGDGSHQFSRTYAEHLRAVRKYQLGKRRRRRSAAGQS
jgi:UPF0755 protein